MECIGQKQVNGWLESGEASVCDMECRRCKTDHSQGSHQSGTCRNESSLTKDLVEYSNKRGSGRGCEDVLIQVASRR